MAKPVVQPRKLERISTGLWTSSLHKNDASRDYPFR